MEDVNNPIDRVYKQCILSRTETWLTVIRQVGNIALRRFWPLSVRVKAGCLYLALLSLCAAARAAPTLAQASGNVQVLGSVSGAWSPAGQGQGLASGDADGKRRRKTRRMPRVPARDGAPPAQRAAATAKGRAGSHARGLRAMPSGTRSAERKRLLYVGPLQMKGARGSGEPMAKQGSGIGQGGQATSENMLLLALGAAVALAGGLAFKTFMPEVLGQVAILISGGANVELTGNAPASGGGSSSNCRPGLHCGSPADAPAASAMAQLISIHDRGYWQRPGS